MKSLILLLVCGRAMKLQQLVSELSLETGGNDKPDAASKSTDH